MMRKAILTIFILIALLSSVAALEVPLYQVEKVDVSLNVLSGTVGNPSSCANFNGQCTTGSGGIGGEPGVLENCYANTAVTTCHCDFLGCGTGASCVTGDFQCVGSNYADGLPCPTPGIQTNYCESGVCNLLGRCGAIPECSKLNDKSYQSNSEIGLLSNCKATNDVLSCECDFEVDRLVTSLATGIIEVVELTNSIEIDDVVETTEPLTQLSFWDRFWIATGLKSPTGVATGGFYGSNPGNCVDGDVYIGGDCRHCNSQRPLPTTPPAQTRVYTYISSATGELKCGNAETACTSGKLASWEKDTGKFVCCSQTNPYAYDGYCNPQPPSGCTDECSQDGCSGTNFWYCYDYDGDGCNEKETLSLNFNNYDVYDYKWEIIKGSGRVSCSNGILTELYCRSGNVGADVDNCPSNVCETSTTCAGSTCTPEASYKCYSGSIYYYDSCGVKGAMKEQCSSSCNEGSTQCNSPCEGKCTINTKQCVGSSQSQVCQEDNVGCLEWSPPTACAYGEECSNGNCQQIQEHFECKNGACMKVPGAGTNQCASEGASCGSHTECQNNMCVQVNTPGANTCSSPGTSCGTQYHTECINNACQQVAGPGDNTCTSNSECGGGGNFTTEAIIIGLVVLLVGGFTTYAVVRKKKKKTKRSKKK